MDSVEENLANWKASLMASIPVAGLISRNETAYKWKALFRCWMLREAAFWRVQDLLAQSLTLHKQRHGLGARILLRSAFETLATLVHLNQLIQAVIDDKLNFHEFGLKTSVLLLGSRDESTSHKSMNIVTVLDKCEKRYPGIIELYALLSESAHPNYEGLCVGYSTIDHSEHQTNFSNRWMEMYGDRHVGSMDLCMVTFQHEYNEVWPRLMSSLEGWVVARDAELEASKPSRK